MVQTRPCYMHLELKHHGMIVSVCARAHTRQCLQRESESESERASARERDRAGHDPVAVGGRGGGNLCGRRRESVVLGGKARQHRVPFQLKFETSTIVEISDQHHFPPVGHQRWDQEMLIRCPDRELPRYMRVCQSVCAFLCVASALITHHSRKKRCSKFMGLPLNG